MKLDNLRKTIDSLNSQIVDLLAKRNQTVKAIALIKKEQGIPIQDKEREHKIIKELEQKSKKHSLDPKFVKKVFKLIFRNSKKEQKKL